MANQNLDIKVNRKESLGGLYDINIENGDFQIANNFDTTLQMSLLAERRADASEVAIPQYRRGWFGNELSDIAGFQIGSKLWLLEQARRTRTTLNLAINYAKEALNWMVEDDLIESFEINGEFTGTIGIRLNITLVIAPDQIETRFLELWNNTQATQDERSL